MNFLKKLKWTYVSASAILIALGVICVSVPDVIAKGICYVAGALMLVYGITKVILYFASKQPFIDSLIVGVLLTLIGFVMIFRHDEVIKLIYAFAGILLLLDGVVKMIRSFESRGAQQRDWFVLLIISVVVIALGVLVIADPFGAEATLVVMLGASLIVDGVQNLYVACHAAYWLRRTEKAAEKVPLSDYKVEDTADN